MKQVFIEKLLWTVWEPESYRALDLRSAPLKTHSLVIGIKFVVIVLCFCLNTDWDLYLPQRSNKLRWKPWIKCIICSVTSDSLQLHGMPSARLLCHGILQARILEWVAISSSRESFRPRDWTQISSTEGRFFSIWATREAHST